jgi:membrane protease YdiL (CAAX protease family)
MSAQDLSKLLPSLIGSAFGVLLAFALSAMCLLPPVRRALARFIPIEPNNFVHAVALSLLVGVIVLAFLPLIVMGEPPLLKMLNGVDVTTGGATDSPINGSIALRSQGYTLLWIIPCAIIAVGAGITRNLRQAVARLGLARPTLREVALGIGAAIGMVIAVSLISALMKLIFDKLGLRQTDEEAFNKIIQFALNPLGALVVAISAGLGEELAVRGVLQPRLGIVLSNLFFTALHAYQYNFDGLIVVFCIGLVMGVLRRKTNTTTSAIAHGTYDLILLVIAMFASQVVTQQ